jgi:superfamily I DNA and/or RNA helicase
MKKKISSIFSASKNKELSTLKGKYEEARKEINEIIKHSRQLSILNKKISERFNLIYHEETGNPDEAALKCEHDLYRLLEEEYLPAFKKNEKYKNEIKSKKIEKEVYEIYLDTLNKKGGILNIKIYRLKTEIHLKIKEKYDLEAKYNNVKESINYYKKYVNKLKKAIISEIINDAELIASTAISSCHYFLDDTNFEVMIMDEATQVASFMSLLPLLKCKKFVLVGDNKQLQPISDEDISDEMNLSIFNRLLEFYPENRTFLGTQYRMNKSIAEIANEIFYQGKLKTSEKIAKKILNFKSGKHKFLSPKMPAVFIDTSKRGYYEEEIGAGCSNLKEAEYVAFIASLLIKNKMNPKEIGIITPFVRQKILIEECLKAIKIKGVEVNTIHRFQGREKEAIIVSFSRSKKYAFSHMYMKFLENETLINVAITRAKRKLILIGNTMTLRQSKTIFKVLNKLEKENVISL